MTFTYKASDHPARITYYMLGRDVEDAGSVLVWNAGIHVKPKQLVTGIEYRVTSDGGISSVTYTTGGFSQQQDTSISGTMWSKKIPNEDVSYPTLVAQNAGGGSITCSITRDGQEIGRQTSHGQYAVVTCTAG